MIAEFISPEILGIVLIAVMLFSIFVGFPISFTLIFLGFVFGYLGFGHLVFYLMTLQFSMVMTEQTLAAVPLFVFMGIMMEQAGLMERLFSAVQMMLSRVRGSLFYAVLFVSIIFAAATGIVGASVTILGIMAAKSMNKSGYDVRLSAGTITAGGTLGILIPPSIMLVVMGPIMEIPVTDLFAAAIIPGIMLAVIYAGYTTIRCYLNPSLGPVVPEEDREKKYLSDRLRVFYGASPASGSGILSPWKHSLGLGNSNGSGWMRSFRRFDLSFGVPQINIQHFKGITYQNTGNYGIDYAPGCCF